MFMHPEIASQLIRDRERQMLAEASQRRLRYPQHHPGTAARAKGAMRTLIMSLTAAAAIAIGAAAAPVAHAATHPAAAMSAHAQPGSQYAPPDPC